MLLFESFRKIYGGKKIIDISSLTIPQGLHWIRGKNGSGKSTLFRCISGISPFEGSLVLNSKINLKKEPVLWRKKVNYAEAEPLFPDILSGREMLEFVAKTKKASSQQIEQVISRFSLNMFFENPAATYSSGMTKKIANAMAFLGEPELILLDEPFITLDSESCIALEEMMANAGKLGCSILLSNHPDFNRNSITIQNTWEMKDGLLQLIS